MWRESNEKIEGRRQLRTLASLARRIMAILVEAGVEQCYFCRRRPPTPADACRRPLFFAGRAKVEGRDASLYDASMAVTEGRVNALLAEYLPAPIVGIVDSFFLKPHNPTPLDSTRERYILRVAQCGHPEYKYTTAGLGTMLKGLALAGHRELLAEQIADLKTRQCMTPMLDRMALLSDALTGACAGGHTDIMAYLIAAGARHCEWCCGLMGEHVG
jgi:hypothetical protein